MDIDHPVISGLHYPNWLGARHFRISAGVSWLEEKPNVGQPHHAFFDGC